MVRRHISAPEWLWDRVEQLAQADGRSVTELVRRLLINHLRREEGRLLGETPPLPSSSRVGHYKRASKSIP
jgi:Ribbon-helix-helix protein, copG family